MVHLTQPPLFSGLPQGRRRSVQERPFPKSTVNQAVGRLDPGVPSRRFLSQASAPRPPGGPSSPASSFDPCIETRGNLSPPATCSHRRDPAGNFLAGTRHDLMNIQTDGSTMRSMLSVSGGSQTRPQWSAPSGQTRAQLRLAEGRPELGMDVPAWTATTRPRARVAAIMFTVDSTQRAALTAVLGGYWEVRDGRCAEHADAVLFRPCSHQTSAALHRRFPGARFIVVDSPLEITQCLGPIQKLLVAVSSPHRSRLNSSAA